MTRPLIVSILVTTFISCVGVAFGQAGSSSWSEARDLLVPESYSTIQEAIDVALDGMRVSVGPGVYRESFDLRGKDLVVFGRFGLERTVIETLNGSTLVRCEGGEPPSSGLRDLTFRGGMPAVSGVGSSASILRCRFTHEASSPSTQGIVWSGGQLNVSEVSFDSLSSNGSGGALFCEQTTLILSDCIFTNNSALNGGAVAVQDSSLLAIDSLFLDNTSQGMGGALRVIGTIQGLPEVTLEGCSFLSNQGDYGGAIFVGDQGLSLTECQVIGNSASYGGGLATAGSRVSHIRVERSRFKNNAALHAGGAVNVGRYSATIENSIFHGNRVLGAVGGLYANGGGALYLFTGETVRVDHCVFYGNDSTNPNADGGSAVYGRDAYPLLTQCIFWANPGVPIRMGSGYAFLSYSLVQGGFEGTEIVDQDPLFVDPVNGDFHLQDASPAIDRGDPTSSPPQGALDYEGNPRVQFCRVDIGPFESSSFADCNQNGQGDACEVTLGGAPDVNGNLVPDTCDIDCNGNGMPDDYEIEQGFVLDCDFNGVPDDCDIDCNSNGMPDSCDVGSALVFHSDLMGPVDRNLPLSFVIKSAPLVDGDVIVRVDARGDLHGVDEFLDIELGGVPVGRVFESIEFGDCFPFTTVDLVRIPAPVFNALGGAQDAAFSILPSASVDDGVCSNDSYAFIQVFLRSKAQVSDCDGNEVPDTCDLANCSGASFCQDCNQNGVLDGCDVHSEVELRSARLEPLLYGNVLMQRWPSLAPSLCDVLIDFEAIGDISTADEWISVYLNSTLLGTVYRVGAKDYPSVPDRARLSVSQDRFNGALVPGQNQVSLVPSFWIDDTRPSWIEMRLTYQAPDLTQDQNGDGVPDACAPTSAAAPRRLR